MVPPGRSQGSRFLCVTTKTGVWNGASHDHLRSTDSTEGQAALEAAADEAAQLGLQLVAVNLTSSDLDTSSIAQEVRYEVVVPQGPSDLDEVEQVLKVIENHPEVTLLVVGVRKRSAIGRAVLGSIPQRLILDATVPVLSVKASEA